MAQGTIITSLLVYTDESESNDPSQRIFDWKLTDEIVSMSYPTVLSMAFAAGINVVTMPSSPMQWLYIVTDQTIELRFNGETANNIVVSPSAAGTADGVFLKRGAFTSLSVNVPGVVAANTTIFMGY